MVNPSQIKPHMPVVCSNNGQFGVVDHVEGQNQLVASDDLAFDRIRSFYTTHGLFTP
jgi:hypothetical protein